MATVKISDLTTIWNTGSFEYVGIKLNVSDVSSSATSRLLDLQINSSSVFYVQKDGQVTAQGLTGSIEGTASLAQHSISSSYSSVSEVAITTVSASYAVNATNAAVCANYLPIAGGTMAGALNLNSDPSAPQQAATKNYVDNLIPTYAITSGYSSTASRATTASYALTASNCPNYVLLTGATMSGILMLSADPTASLAAATKNYVDNVASILSPSSSISSSYALTASTAATASVAPNYLLLAGGTMSGTLTLSAGPTASLDATTKNYVDNLIPSSSVSASLATTASYSKTASVAPNYLPLAGGQMTGHINLYSDPVDPTQAATKNYVDNFTSPQATSASYATYAETASVATIALTASYAYKLLITGSAYADNATALSGGLAVGDFYRTGTDPDYICIVH